MSTHRRPISTLHATTVFVLRLILLGAASCAVTWFCIWLYQTPALAPVLKGTIVAVLVAALAGVVAWLLE